jgi:hypothetical protein
VVLDLAAAVGLDAERFREDLNGDAAQRAFGDAQQRTRAAGATSFPTFRVEVDGRHELLRGYKPFASFQKLFAEADVDLREHDPRPVVELVEHYDRVATREVAEVHDISTAEARSRLAGLADEGRVRRVEAGTDFLWESA